jgi:3-oxoadipate enol-lactonase
VKLTGGLYSEIHDPDEREERPPLVLLPGLQGDGRQMSRVIARLKRRRRVLCVDPLGGGRSDASGDLERYSWSAQADALSATLDAHRIDRADVVGWSLGGVWAQHALMRDPQRFGHAVLCATSARLSARERCILLGLAAVIDLGPRPEDLARLMTAFLFSPSFLAQPGAVATAETFLSRLHVGAGLRAQVHALLEHQLDEELSKLQQVRAVIAGEADWLMPPVVGRRLAQRLNAPLVVLSDLGHLLWVESLDAFVAAVESALEPR